MARQPSLIWIIGTVFIFALVRAIWNICQYIKWTFDGTQAHISRGNQPGNFAVSAQVLSIKGKYNLSPLLTPANLNYFILAHHSFVNPEYVLQDNVSLYSHTDKDAVFVEVPPEVEEWSMNVSPFHRVGQFNNAIRIIVMPRSSFYILAKQLAKKAQPKIVFGYAMPRSGSTVLRNIFESTGCCVAYSEPAVLTDPFLLWKKCESRDEEEAWKRLFIASVRILCKPRSYPVKLFFFKLFTGHYKLDLRTCVSTLRDNFSNVGFFLIYRNGIDCVKSTLKVWKHLDFVRIVDWATKYIPGLRLKLLLTVMTPEDKEKYPVVISVLRRYVNHPQCSYLKCVYAWASHLARYQQFTGEHLSIMPSVKYEDLVKQPHDVISAMFTHCGIAQDCVPKAIATMKTDSQANSSLNRENLMLFEPEEPCSEIRPVLSQICTELGVPDIYDDCRVISCINNKSRHF